MSVDRTIVPDDARCKSCGYSLRGISARRCPECGQEFDPADSRTLHLGKPAGIVGRFVLRPTGAIPIVLSCIAAAALLCVSRLPLSHPKASWVELQYYFRPSGFRDRIATVSDLIYVAAICLALLPLLYLPLRFLGRIVASRHYHRAPDRPVHLGFEPWRLA